jgi:hypothetical protein
LNVKVVTSSSYHFGAVGMAHPDNHMAVAKTKELNKVCVKGAFESSNQYLASVLVRTDGHGMQVPSAFGSDFDVAAAVKL